MDNVVLIGVNVIKRGFIFYEINEQKSLRLVNGINWSIVTNIIVSDNDKIMD